MPTFRNPACPQSARRAAFQSISNFPRRHIQLRHVRAHRVVLLFPAAAQAASWSWWHEYRWPPDDPKGTICAQLLAETVLYKVSHRGLWSGTARDLGLDMMTSPDLVAMISVDQNAARGKRWAMPDATLLAALARRTRGRIIRSDQAPPTTQADDSD